MDFEPPFFDKEYGRLYALCEADLSSSFSGLQRQSSLCTTGTESSSNLLDSIFYSLFSGGKRFRPVLTLAVAEALGGEVSHVFPWARAIEFVHTYSLIHDDLPALDNDDFRRGQPTNHKKFGEATAILAGDALLTEAYGCLQDIRLDKTSALISLLTEAAGLRGMVAGQAMDIDFPSSLGVNSNYLVQIHKLKTASLIRAACEGSALIVLSREQQALRAYGEHLGLSFQIADDILDKDEGEKQNLVSMIGPCGTQDLLEYHIDQAIKVAQNLPRPEFLVQLALFNLSRKK